jgi:transcriptional regulator with XRE-family HTH domain
MDPKKVALGRKIREAREKAKLTQGQLAKALGLNTKQAISHWEVGRWAPEAILLPSIARELRVSIDWLLSSASPTACDTWNTVVAMTTEDVLSFAKGLLKIGGMQQRRPTLVHGGPDTLLSLQINRAMERPDGGGIAAGSYITIDTARIPEPGDVVVVALLASGELITGRYRPGQRGDFTIKADNPDFQERAVTKKDRPRIVGTLVERIQIGSR